MKEKSKLRTLLWLIFPLGLLLGCMGDRNSARWSITIIILGVSLILSLIYFLSRKKAVGIIAVIIAFLGIVTGLMFGVAPNAEDMYRLIRSSRIFSFPIIQQVMELLVTVFSKISYEIAGFMIRQLVFAGAIYVLPALFVLVFYLRTKKCFKLIDVEAKRAAQQQQRMNNAQSAAVRGRQGLEQLKKLGELHRIGALTDEEFQHKKTEILGKM